MLVASLVPAQDEPPVAATARPDPGSVEACRSCHGQPGFSVVLAGGETLGLTVDFEAFESSVHGKKHDCRGCHRGMEVVPHPPLRAETRAEVREALGRQCLPCHLENYTRTLDSVHEALHARGDPRAPDCTACHGAHDVASPGEPRARVSRTCAPCHSAIYEAYARSIHGKALLTEGNPDVPVCTDCHRSHAIAGPHSGPEGALREETCDGCHANSDRMARYGLSTGVLGHRLADFHGRTASLRGGGREDREPSASCADCHGVHDIARADDTPASVLEANLRARCAACHGENPPEIPDAWLSHYDPGSGRAPLLRGVRLFFTVLVPLLLAGLLLQLLLHAWRLVVSR